MRDRLARRLCSRSIKDYYAQVAVRGRQFDGVTPREPFVCLRPMGRMEQYESSS